MKLSVKYMVCDRCIRVVEQVVAELKGVNAKQIGLGFMELEEPIDSVQRVQLNQALATEGFELLDDEKEQRVEQIKNLIVKEVHHTANKKGENQNYSSFLTKKIGMDYSYLNDLFSATEGKTIGQFITLQKIERAKELLIYDQLSLAEIADQLEYNSGQYLSAQFKRVTGMTPSVFKKIGSRQAIDKL
ncbi:MAG: AraC family transcriptional regulator [Roseivirga sp.]|nr:AraC family transcriptional regulator [Roseivirga sp.]